MRLAERIPVSAGAIVTGYPYDKLGKISARDRQSLKGLLKMGILAWILVGLVGGVVAKFLVPGDDPGGSGPLGIVITIAIGILGAMLGGFLAVAMGISDGVNNFDIGTIFLSIAGAVLLLVGYNAVTKGGRGVHA